MKSSVVSNQRGIAVLETVPLLVIFVTLMGFGIGMYGAVQTAILHSIGARTYAFETFRQRSNLYYLREDGTGTKKATSMNYTAKGWRYHGIQHESDPRNSFVATTRNIAYAHVPQKAGDNTDETNNRSIYDMKAQNTTIPVNPIWIMVGYGICLNKTCGDK